MKRIDNYLDILYLVEEANLIQEGLGDVIKNLTTNKGKQLVTLLKSGNMKKFKSATDTLGFGRIKPKKMDSFAKTKIAGYGESKDFAKRVLKNSIPGLSKKVLEAASSAIATASVIPQKKGVAPKSPAKRSRQLVKEIVVKARKWQDEYMDSADDDKKRRIPPESLPDYAVGITTVLSMTILLSGGIWVFWNYILPAAILLFWVGLIGSIAGVIFYGVIVAAGGGKH